MQSPISLKKDQVWSMFPTPTTDLSCSLASVSFKRSAEQQQRSPKLLQNQARYKTEICRSFEENGCCRYGDKCQFAHGQDEVRLTNRHPKYKTQMCRTFHSYGFCPYGPRCHFIHNEDSLGLDLSGSSSPTSLMFFSDNEDPFSCREPYFDNLFPFPSSLAVSAARNVSPSHKRLPVFALLNKLE